VEVPVIASSATVLDRDLHPSGCWVKRLCNGCRRCKTNLLPGPNCIINRLNLRLGQWEAVMFNCLFRPNQIAVHNYFEITGSAGVPDFSDRDLALEGFLQLLFQQVGLPPVASSATVLDRDVHSCNSAIIVALAAWVRHQIRSDSAC